MNAPGWQPISATRSKAVTSPTTSSSSVDSASATGSPPGEFRHWLTLLRTASLLALLMSTALLLQYLDPATRTFCGVDSGCDAVRKSVGGYVTRTHLVPAAGVAGYALVFALTFHPQLRRLFGWAAGFGGVVGIGLLALQAFGIGTFCSLCVAVDLLACAAGISGIHLAVSRQHQSNPLRWWGWTALFAIAINTPSIWTSATPPRTIPDSIAQLRQRGVLNVFEFVDFQCPHCRRLHPVLKREVELSTSKVHFRRFYYPLSFHPLADATARAAVCAAEQGKEDAMAALLFEEPLSDGVWITHARSLSLDVSAFETCLTSERATATLAEHAKLYRSTGYDHLPLTFVGNEVIDGAPRDSQIVAAFLAAQSQPRAGIPPWLFLTALGGSIGLVVLLSFDRHRSGPPS